MTAGSRWAVRIGVGLLVLIGLLILLLAAFPWGMFKGRIEDRLSDRIGKRVSAAFRDCQALASLNNGGP